MSRVGVDQLQGGGGRDDGKGREGGGRGTVRQSVAEALGLKILPLAIR